MVAVDSEQHVDWVRARWGVELEGGEGFRAIAGLIGSRVEYRRLDASSLGELDETFDFVFCFGILHRVSDPLGLLRMLGPRRDALAGPGPARGGDARRTHALSRSRGASPGPLPRRKSHGAGRAPVTRTRPDQQ